jgi:N-acetylglutamate synthase-like GNAT family acetyltransferase
MARHRGFRLVKSRRRKPGAGDYGRYGLADARNGKECFGFGSRGLEATAEQIEQFLRGKAQAEWKSSLSAPIERPRPARRKQPSREHRERPERAPRPSSGRPRATKAAVREAPARRPPQQPAAAPAQARLEIREAAPRDAGAIAQLLDDISERVDSKVLRKTIGLLSRQGNPLLVADQDGVAGCAGWEIMMIPQYSTPVGRITLLVIAKSARRRGIGAALLEAIEGLFKREKCGLVEIVHDIELSSANSFLREHGYKRSGYRFVRELSDRKSD